MSEIDFIGDRYRRSKAWIKSMKGGKNGNMGSETRNSADMKPTERPTGLEEQDDKRLYRQVWCWDIYLPKQKLVCLFVEGEEKPIQVYKWDGPKEGPYDLIGFDWAPDMVLPSPPVINLLPLHNVINVLTRKLERQAARQKTLTVYRAGGEDDASAIKKAMDGQTVALTDPESVRELKFGGPDPLNSNMEMQFENEFDTQAGGLQTLGGTEAMADTARQEMLMNRSASVQVQKMQEEVFKSLDVLIRKHAWYIWTDNLRSYDAIKSDTTGKYRWKISIDPEVREGDFLDYNFKINPYSLKERTPEQEAQALIGLWNTVIIPNMPLYQASRQMPNAVEYTNRVMELMDIKSFDVFVPMQGGMGQGGGDEGQPIEMPQQMNQPQPPQRQGPSRNEQVSRMMEMNSRMAASNATK
jgi:hypothetical protein